MPRRPGKSASGQTILVVDDHAAMLEAIRGLLEREGHRVVTACSGADALAVLAREPVQLILVDYVMPGMSGEELIRRVRARDALVQIVLQTGQAGDQPPRTLLRQLGIQGYHDKSEGPERLLMWVDLGLRAYEQLAQLHIAERLKAELLANVSHEFRTPLHVIIGYVELAREGTFGSIDSEVTTALERVLGNSRYLLQLVEEFLDLSRLEAGDAVPARRETVDLPAFLREMADWFGLVVGDRPLAFACEVTEDLPPAVAEASKLRVILRNLLENAEKFTEDGRVALRARVLDHERVAIEVSDTGPGVPAEHHETIFDVFHQLRPHDGRRRGVGLGLALARRFARMMCGDITVESTVGVGSTFTVVLPVAGGGMRDGELSRLREEAA